MMTWDEYTKEISRINEERFEEIQLVWDEYQLCIMCKLKDCDECTC
jgi:hypothetical protein